MAVLNPKNAPWNAKGDGKTDDQKALQSCFDAARAGGHSVLIPAGTYNHSSTLTLDGIKVAGVNSKAADGPVTMLYATAGKYRAVVMKGNGPEITRLRIHAYGTARKPAGVGASPWLSMVYVLKGTRNFRITHIWIEGDNKTTSQPNVAGIFIDDATDGYVARNTMMHTTADCFHFRTNGTGRNARNIVEYNYVWMPGDDGTAFVGYTGGHVSNCISRYNFVGNNRGGRGCTAVGTEKCQIVGNLIHGGPNGRAGIMIAAEGGNYNTGGNRFLLVRDNTVIEAGGDGKSVEGDRGTHHGAIHVYNGSGAAENFVNHDVTIINNQVYKAKTDAFVIDGGVGGYNITLSDNEFYGAKRSAIQLGKTPTKMVNSGNSGNQPLSAWPGPKALGGAVGRHQAAARVGVNTTWTAGGVAPEPQPTVYLPEAASVTEGGSVTVTVTKSGTGACSVTVATALGTAGPADFTAIPPTVLTFDADQKTKTVTLQTTADALVEKNETVNLVLSSPSGCTVSNTTCAVTIVDSTVPLPVDPVPLPWPARTEFDITIHLDKDTRRAFSGTDVAGKHVRVIPKTKIDTAKGLFFEGAASVTLIGGAFRPSAPASSGDASLYFRDCGAIHLEGVLVDNASIAQGHAVLVHAGTAETDITLQNCRLVNVTGSDKGVRGTVFSTGTAGTGRAGSVRLHNVTATTNTGTRGLYVPPETDGGLTELLLRNVNFRRTTASGGFGFYHFLNSAADFDAGGYPIHLDNVWGELSTGQKVEVHGVWPNSGAGTNTAFGPTFAAVRAPDPLNGDRTGAHWPQMTDPARHWEGYIYEGLPPGGDFVPASKVGLTYAAGIDLVETTPPHPVLFTSP
jgi:hypothetical protein